MSGEVIGRPTLMSYLEEAIAEFPDRRTGDNTQYSLRDSALGAFSVFFTQSPSFLSHQQSMHKSKGSSNATTIFGIEKIPTDNWIRTLLDPVPSRGLSGVFRRVFERLEAQGSLDTYRAFDDTLLVALDGTWFHSSESVNCVDEHVDRNCTVRNDVSQLD